MYISINLGKKIPLSRWELPEYYRTCFCSIRYKSLFIIKLYISENLLNKESF